MAMLVKSSSGHQPSPLGNHCSALFKPTPEAFQIKFTFHLNVSASVSAKKSSPVRNSFLSFLQFSASVGIPEAMVFGSDDDGGWVNKTLW